MAQNPLSPILGNNTKATIIQTLTEKQPQTIKELHNSLQKNLNKPTTYQATHKTVNELVQENILVKNSEKKYEISKAWAYQLEDLARIVTKDGTTKKGSIKTYSFFTFSEFASAIIKLVHDAPNPENHPGVCITKHAWPPIGLSKHDCELLTELLAKTQYHDISTKNTPLGKAFAKTLEKMGKKVIVGSKLSHPMDFICTGNDVFEVIFDEKTQEELDRIFCQHKKLDENAITDILQNIITKPSQIRILHTNSQKYAQELREKIMREFKDD